MVALGKQRDSPVLLLLGWSCTDPSHPTSAKMTRSSNPIATNIPRSYVVTVPVLNGIIHCHNAMNVCSIHCTSRTSKWLEFFIILDTIMNSCKVRIYRLIYVSSINCIKHSMDVLRDSRPRSYHPIISGPIWIAPAMMYKNIPSASIGHTSIDPWRLYRLVSNPNRAWIWFGIRRKIAWQWDGFSIVSITHSIPDCCDTQRAALTRSFAFKAATNMSRRSPPPHCSSHP